MEPPRPTVRFLRDMRILVVDDQPDLRDMLVALLEQQGAEVVGCSSARQAFAVISGGGRFDAAIFDVTMPVEDGLVLVERLRRWEGDDPAAHLPVIALTAHGAPDIRALCAAAGFDGFLPKPAVPRLLFDTLRRLARPH